MLYTSSPPDEDYILHESDGEEWRNKPLTNFDLFLSSLYKNSERSYLSLNQSIIEDQSEICRRKVFQILSNRRCRFFDIQPHKKQN